MSTGLILGIESSCDETAAAIVRSGRDVLSNIVSSQIEMHALYGGGLVAGAFNAEDEAGGHRFILRRHSTSP